MTTQILINNWPLILGVLAVLATLIAIMTGRRQRVELSDPDPIVGPTLARVAVPDPLPPQLVTAPLVLAAVVVPPAGPVDDLRRIKGLGPKVAARFGELGITRFEQLAALDAAGQAALDAQLGSFAGRMARDRWVEQAALLASDDVATFEAQFGKLS